MSLNTIERGARLAPAGESSASRPSSHRQADARCRTSRCFMASYDIDRFRAFAASPSFSDTYDVTGRDHGDADRRRRSAARLWPRTFLRHALFGEKFAEERPDAYEKRLARRRRAGGTGEGRGVPAEDGAGGRQVLG
ncbi:MAG: hypothetical protein MZW92_35565 [Comamonadaceae bacterium]|nr:hypothetical protein [Comamonadaceae bacterium]